MREKATNKDNQAANSSYCCFIDNFIYIFFRTCSVESMATKLSLAMFECTDAGRNGEDIANTIISFADDCQISKNLTVWPAKETCGEFESEINLYPFMAELCSPDCPFGERSSSASECVCEDGYWGMNCTNVCPGGAGNPCNGFGTCDRNGSCNCPVNWQGSIDCSRCSDGWLNDNCTVVKSIIQPGNDSFALIGRLGISFTLDGVIHSVKTHGELLLMSVADIIIIEGKFIVCHENYSCLSFVAVRIQDGDKGAAVVTVQSRKEKDSKPFVFINDLKRPLDNPVYFEGFSVYRESYRRIVLDVTGHFSIEISVESQYLHVELTVPNILKPYTAGLLSQNRSTSYNHLGIPDLYRPPLFGLCNKTLSVLQNVSSLSGYILPVENYSYPLSTTDGYIDKCDSFIFYPNSKDKEQSQAGFNLFFNGSSIAQTLTLRDDSLLGITFELMVKHHIDTEKEVLFSFASGSTFTLLCEFDSLSIIVNMPEEEVRQLTNLSLTPNTWTKVIMSYVFATGSTSLYVLSDNNVPSKYSIDLPHNLFSGSGTLAIGQTFPASNVKKYRHFNGLKSNVDDFIVWNKALEANQVLELYRMNPVKTRNCQILAYHFNEGDGPETVTHVKNEEFVFPEYPWITPVWEPSDVQYDSTTMGYAVQFYFKNDTLKSLAKDWCSIIFHSEVIQTSCNTVDNATKQYFYDHCLHIKAVTASNHMAVNAIIDLLKICHKSGNLKYNAIDSYCSTLDIETRNLAYCGSPCKFGILLEGTSKCTCYHGYFNQNCNETCPGGSDSPCNDHGKCGSDGICSCLWNWNGDSQCSKCTTTADGSLGGNDCNTIRPSAMISKQVYSAAVLSVGYYRLFNGQQIPCPTITGVFRLFNAGNIDIHVFQAPCTAGMCVFAIFISNKNKNIILSPSSLENEINLYIDEEPFYPEDIESALDDEMSISLISSSEISIKILDGETVDVLIARQGQFLSCVINNINPLRCSGAHGILGSCDVNAFDYSGSSNDMINEIFLSNFSLPNSPIVNVLNISTTNLSGDAHALFFNGAATTTIPIVFTDGYRTRTKDFSISVYFKPYNYGGIIVSYGGNSTFSLYNTIPMQVKCGNDVYTANFGGTLNSWNQIIITFERSHNIMILYHFEQDVYINQKTFYATCPEIFTEDGVITFGEYTSSVSQSKQILSNFTFAGLISEFALWKEPIPTTVIYQAMKLNIRVSGFISQLSSFYSFIEGAGTHVSDLVAGNTFTLPKYPWQSPVWVPSDLILKKIRHYQAKDIDISSRNESFCADFLERVSNLSLCKNISSLRNEWFKQLCFNTISESRSVLLEANIIYEFVTYCEMHGNEKSSLYNVLLELGKNLPNWILNKIHNCTFGVYNGIECTCQYGFYGSKCERVCPGGASNPCNNHGTCNVNGTCLCTGRWTGHDCSECETGWFGENCTLLIWNNSTKGETVVGQINLLGQMLTFDGIMIDVNVNGFLIAVTQSSYDLSLTGKFSPCLEEKYTHPCLTGVILGLASDQYYISHDAFSDSGVVILSSTTSLYLYNKLILGKVELTVESQTTILLLVPSSSLRIRLSSVNNRLMLTVSISETDWLSGSVYGVLASCDTELAIRTANCSSVDTTPCPDSSAVNSTCLLPQTEASLKLFLDRYRYQNESFIHIIEGLHLSPYESNCLSFSGSGISVSDLLLPNDDFTIELHAKPLGTPTGILLSYASGEVSILVVYSKTGLQIIYNGERLPSGILLKTGEWNQISVAYRWDCEVLELYNSFTSGLKF